MLRHSVQNQTLAFLSKAEFDIFIFHMCMYVHTLCVHLMPSQAEGSSPLELELQMDMSHHVGIEPGPLEEQLCPHPHI